MSESTVFCALKQTGYPVHMLGAHGDASLPRVSYSFPMNSDFRADDDTYKAMQVCEVRLYTDRYQDPEAEEKVERALRCAGYRAWNIVRTPVESERMHETTYTFTDPRKG